LGEVPKAEGVTIKVNDESLYDLLPPKMDSQFIRPPKVPEGGNSSHKIFSAGVISRRSSLARCSYHYYRLGKLTENP